MSQFKDRENSSDLFGGEFFTSPCHHRVLKPPGGGSHDIFGADEPDKPVVSIRKLSSQSSINLSEEVNGTNGTNGSDAGSLKQGSCNERLFGPPLMEEIKMNGNLANGKEETVADGPVHVNGTSNEVNKVAQLDNGNCAGRKRVPPGGFSSGLW